MQVETMFSRTSMVVAASDQVSSELADEVVILSLRNGVYYGLNPVGARIWQLIQQPTTIATVIDTLLDEYDVEPEQCERDAYALLEHLREEGLVEVRQGQDNTTSI